MGGGQAANGLDRAGGLRGTGLYTVNRIGRAG